MRDRLLMILIMVSVVFMTAPAVVADVPTLIGYQGVLLDSEGDPVTEPVNVTFTIYDSPSDGAISWQEMQLVEFDENGRFDVSLGEITPITDDVFEDPVRWLGVQVEGDDELVPRTRIVSVGYANRISTVDGATGGTVSGDLAIQSDLDVDGDIRVTGKATIGPGHTNTGLHAFVAGENNTASVDHSTVGGGYHNIADGYYTTVGGGWDNATSSQSSTVGGGQGNTASGVKSVVAGGAHSTASGDYSSVGGGRVNTASGYISAIAGGNENTADGNYTTVGGGETNTATGEWSTVAGGVEDTASGSRSMVGGGVGNTASGEYSIVGGGYHNSATAPASVVAGGQADTASGSNSVVAGGTNNSSSGNESTVGGGSYNTASGLQGTVSGGYAGEASGESSTIGGGWHNYANGSVATVAGGQQDTASGNYTTVAGGLRNVASGDQSTVGGGWDNTASGECAVIPGGCHNLILGDFSIAMGSGAKAIHNGSFVWADAAIDELESTADNQIMMLGSGGTWIYSDIDLLSGVTIHPGASAWATYSDRDLKENLTTVDSKEILQKISSLPVNEWNFKAQSENIRHIGPSAQDFYSTFGLGDDDKTISTIDPSGVALAGIQALLDKIEQLETRIAELEAERR